MNLAIGRTLLCLEDINHLFRVSEQYPWLKTDPGLTHDGPGITIILAGKATFGFGLHCAPQTDDAWGHITYHDHGVTAVDFEAQGATWKGKAKTLAIQGEVFTGTDFLGDDGCSDDDVFYANYLGTYTPIPASIGKGSLFQVIAHDGGETEPVKEDHLEIWMISGVYAGYANAGKMTTTR